MTANLLAAAAIACAFPALLHAQSPRFVEVHVKDTVHLRLKGIDYEVRMGNPLETGIEPAYESYEAQEVEERPEKAPEKPEKQLIEAMKKAVEDEARFKALMKTNNFSYRLASTEHAEDYMFETGTKYDVNVYVVQLKDSMEIAKYYEVTKGTTFTGAMKELRYADAGSEAPRLMRKLYAQARVEAEALVAATGGKLGQVISAQELEPNEGEGSILELLLRFEKDGNKEEMRWMLGSTHSSTMAFRFELLP